MDWNEFLKSIWETKCHHFAFDSETKSERNGKTPIATANVLPRSSDNKNLWNETVDDGFNVLTHMMDTTHPICEDDKNNSNSNPPLLFRDRQPMDDAAEISQLYGTSLYAAYLAGTSIVWNHANQISPRIAALCQNLQICFPHAYANAYLTPPHSQTVPAHADDRDVLVFQLCGRKKWKVYEQVPILHPYSHQQVGKSGLPVPEAVLRGPLAFDGYLGPGDVLYLPRGMVHEASTASTDFSFHITVALATHDWTLAGNLNKAIQTQLLEKSATTLSANKISTNDETSRQLRRSLLPRPATYESQKEWEDRIQAQLDRVFESLRSQITAKSILSDMEHRITAHNDRAFEKCRWLLQSETATINRSLDCQNDGGMDFRVGPLATKFVSLETLLRASTPTEKEHAQAVTHKVNNSPTPGLTVRDEVGNEVGIIVTTIKGGQQITVKEFSSLCANDSSLCDLTAVSLAKRAVELGAFTIVTSTSAETTNLAGTKRQRIDDFTKENH